MTLPEAMKNIGTVIIKSDQDTLSLEDICSVCLQEYVQGEKLRQLVCKHYFHQECLDCWLFTLFQDDQYLVCPLCKQDVD